MFILEIPRQSTRPTLVGPWRMKEALEPLPMRAEPGSSLLPLPLCLTEGRRPHQWLSRVRPPIRVRLPHVVVLQKYPQPFLELRCVCEVAPLQETPRQHAEEQFHLIQPRA